jgi:hypothetical protein
MNGELKKKLKDAVVVYLKLLWDLQKRHFLCLFQTFKDTLTEIIWRD